MTHILTLSILILYTIASQANPQINKKTAAIKIKANSAKIHTFKETSKNHKKTIQWTEKIENGKRKIELNSDNEKEIVLGRDSVNTWAYKNISDNKQITINVTNDVAKVTITKKNNTTIKSTPLKSIPIKYPISFFMQDFITNNQNKTVSWIPNKYDGTLHQMIFTKLKNEPVKINGTTIACIKIEMKPPGFAGMLWKAHYWFDQKNGMFVKYIGKKGPPGSPDFTIERISPHPQHNE